MRTRLGFAVLGLAASAGLGWATEEPALERGRAFFERAWSEAADGDGLGPLFTERSCASCHQDAGAAQFLDVGDGKLAVRGLVARFGDAAGRPDPLYGAQLQTHAEPGLLPEGRLSVAAPSDAQGALAVGLTLNALPLDPATRMSIRQAPDLGRAALVEAVDSAAVLALADPTDRDGDGISGRARVVEGELHRFGWKAGGRDLAAQIGAAFAIDMGLSSPHRPAPHGDCTALQVACLEAAAGTYRAAGEMDVSDEAVDRIADFLRHLPLRQPAAKSGGAVFATAGCAACHVPTLPAKGGGTATVFSDLLLHDMGPLLDDGVGEPGAAPAEWRTAPLSGLAETPYRRYLHDGRSATLDAAIRSHGGEASRARQRYVLLPDADRTALIDFLGRL